MPHWLKRILITVLILAGLAVGYRYLASYLILTYAAQGRTAYVKLLLDAGVNVNTTKRNGETPLMLAIINRHPQTVQLLLNHGAARWVPCLPLPDCKPAPHFEAFSLALQYADLPTFKVLWRTDKDKDDHELLGEAAGYNNLPVMRFLLSQGVDPTVPYTISYDPSDFRWTTPLHCVMSEEATQLLLDHGAQINMTDSEGSTALHRLMFSYDGGPDNPVPIAKVLLAHAVRVNAVNRDGKTALDLDTGKYPALTTLFIQHGARHAAPRPVHTTPLHKAIADGKSYRKIAELITQGADVTARDGRGRTPLHILATGDGCLEVDDAEVWMRHIADLLLSHGAQINAQDAWGETPLHLVLMYLPNVGVAVPPERAKFARYLMGHGARTDIKNYGGWTPAQISKIWSKRYWEDVCAKGHNAR